MENKKEIKIEYKKEIESIIAKALRTASEDLEDSFKLGEEDEYNKERLKLDTFEDAEREALAQRLHDSIMLDIIETLEKD